MNEYYLMKRNRPFVNDRHDIQQENGKSAETTSTNVIDKIYPRCYDITKSVIIQIKTKAREQHRRKAYLGMIPSHRVYVPVVLAAWIGGALCVITARILICTTPGF